MEIRLKFRPLTLVLPLAFAGGAGEARPLPTPPPSGIVVHLFGPNSVTSNILPAGNAAASPAGADGAPAGGSMATPGGGYAEPSAGQIFHQMFVTGDPNENPQDKLTTGRPGNR